ncbi:MAG: DMT family transporter [Bacteroidetes bacterium]|nr:DMT family transporter [Bacteroidota bacterium]
MRNQTRAYLYALGAILCWSTVASAFKLTLEQTGVGELLLISSWTSLLFLLLIVLRHRNFGAYAHWERREWLHSAMLGLINPLLYYLVLFRAYDLLPAQEAQPLNYTWPIVLVMFSVVFLHQRLRPPAIIAMLLGFSGVIVISTRGAVTAMRFDNLEGVLLAVGSSVLWATYWILNMRSGAEQSMKLTANFLFGALYVTVLYSILPDKQPIGTYGLLGGIYVGVFEMGLTFVLWLRALKLSKVTAHVSNLVFLSPFLSLILIHYVVGEDIYPSTYLGLLLIVAGIAVGTAGKEKRET